MKGRRISNIMTMRIFLVGCHKGRCKNEYDKINMKSAIEGIKTIAVLFSKMFEVGCVILVCATFSYCYANGYIWCVSINSIGEAKMSYEVIY